MGITVQTVTPGARRHVYILKKYRGLRVDTDGPVTVAPAVGVDLSTTSVTVGPVGSVHNRQPSHRGVL